MACITATSVAPPEDHPEPDIDRPPASASFGFVAQASHDVATPMLAKSAGLGSTHQTRSLYPPGTHRSILASHKG